MSGPEVSLTGITKTFGGVVALDGVDLHLLPSRVHALLGENGAGKSTLMGVLFGLVRPDTGIIRVNGAEVLLRSPRDAIQLGIGMVQQHFSHVGAFSVAENVALGGRGCFRLRTARELVQTVSSAAGLQLDPTARLSDLPVGAQQRVEIVRALARGARLLVLDEPTSVLAPSEAEALLAWVRMFADRGGTVVLVTHKVREALAIADDITVLRGGHRVTSRRAEALTPERLAAAMFPDLPRIEGRSRSTPPQPRPPDESPVVRANALAVRGDRGEVAVAHATFTVYPGEVVAVAGVEASGHHELLQTLARVRKPQSGVLLLPPRIAFVPGDRHRDALLLDFTLFENLALHGAGERSGVVDWNGIRHRTRSVMETFEIRARSPNDRARTLSGGNQQRFVLARALEVRPQLLVAEQPTRGLDMNAMNAVHDRLRAAARAGTAVVIHSSDLDEMLVLADRVLVVHAGAVREVRPDREAVGREMVGAI